MATEKKETTRTAKKKSVTFSVNVKYGSQPYRKGESLEVSEKEYEDLLSAGIVESKGD
ncbi:hypothetical protein OR571_13235 [Psychrobacillus sp. NEAU-3TGS]|uniref:DUF7210 family protein n=1 Tax=Psychrobacillus sp. NEAU-3TGS TaxID=2995412 RepID=UPI002496E2D0|nr:hypothetical protein [Psychrobacillus sp. NEAU-3TGS]MDI2588052.1 hypothetical protein [Psychrobacillus sp. NEAU-3TGS]